MKSKKRASSFKWLSLPILLVCLIALLLARTDLGQASALDNPLQAAWQQARQAGEYRYHTTLLQTTWPLPRLENVGLSSSQQRIYLEGTADLPAEMLHMKLWSDEGHVRTAQDAIEIKVENGQAVGRVSQSEWQEIDDVSGLFAPNQDALTWLAAAKEVMRVEPERDDGLSLTRYTFDVDGPAFAAYMRDQMEEELTRQGKLPPGVNLDVARQYVGMTGQGELWLNADGLPLRQVMHLRFPPARLEQVEVEITTDFSGWDENETMAQSPAWMGFIANPGRHLTPRALAQMGQSLGLAAGLLGLLGLMIVYRKSPLVYAAVVLTVVLSMLVTPLLQSHQVYAFSEEQRARQAQVEADRTVQEQAREIQAGITHKDFDPHRDPMSATETQTTTVAQDGQIIPSLETWGLALPSADAAADAAVPLAPSYAATYVTNDGQNSACGPEDEDNGDDADGDGLTDRRECLIGTRSDVADTDGDGLNDGIEVLELGTNPLKIDSDGDGISDQREVQGFTSLSGQVWYLNPTDPDTNGDGQADGIGCSNLQDVQPSGDTYVLVTPSGVRCQDTDNDGTPDAFDFDDDDDGVPDTVDLAPVLAVGGVVEGAISGFADQTMALNVTQLVANKPVFVDFQLRPTNPEHLWYTLNVLDWPSNDREGQYRRVFTDTLGASGKLANGSMQLIPMLEIVIPAQDGFGGLPVKDTYNGARRPALPNLTGLNVISETEQLNTWLASWLDQAEMDKYGISVRVKDKTGALVVYAPLNLVRDTTGDSPVAFSARMVYRPLAAGLGTPQQVRVVWLVHGKNDTCDTSDMPAQFPHPTQPGTTVDKTDSNAYDLWCANTANWESSANVIHRYYDDWYLTGLSVREDRGVKAAVIYEDPAYAGRNPEYEENLWRIARNLQDTFLAGRTNSAGQRDVTVDEIARRFATESAVTGDARWGIPQGATGVLTFTFADQSGLATIPMTHTQQLLQSVFTSGGAALVENPTLLFVREERYRSTGLNMPAIVQAGANSSTTSGVLTSNQLTFKLDSQHVQEQVLASVNWAPYQHKGAGVWESYPIGNYWERMGTIFDRLFANQYSTERPEINARRVRLAQSFYLSLFHGAGTLVEFAGQPIQATSARADAALAISYGEVAVVQSIVQNLSEIIAKIQIENAEIADIMDLTSGYSIFFGTLQIASTVTKLVLMTAGSSEAETIDTALKTVGVVLAIYGVLEATDKVYKTWDAGKEVFSLAAISQSVQNISKAAKTAAIIALVVTSAVAVGLFLAQWIGSGARFGSLAVNELLASMVSTIIVAAIMLAIGLIVPVGTAIVAVIGLIDAAISLVCKVSGLDKSGSTLVKDYVCAGINGSLAKLVQFLIYSNNPLVDIHRPGRMSTGNLRLALEQDSGFQNGNRLRVKLHVTSTLYKNRPNSGLGWLYAWQYSDSNVRDATFGYQISSGQAWQGDLPASHWQDGINGGVATMEADPEYSYLIPFTQVGINQKMPLYLLEKYVIPTQECFLIPFWWTPVCYLRDQEDTLPTSLEDSLVFDIFPDTLDEFYSLTHRGNRSYALAWDSRFPTLCDADGDGLRSSACGGNDPGDGAADFDADGLSDLYEVRNGLLPLEPDSDADGLTDYWEVFHHTNPHQGDTDGDGLSDKVEVDGWSFVYGFDTAGQPLRTWVTSDPLTPDTDGDGILDNLEKVYGFNPRVASDLAVLEISSEINGGEQGFVAPGENIFYTVNIENHLRDRHALGLLEVELPVAVDNESLQPRVYTLAPNQSATLEGEVTINSNAATQAVSLTNRAGAIIADLWGGADGRSLWLHLDDESQWWGQTTFIDASSWGRPGTCYKSTCPTSEVAGYIGRAVRFDGADDFIRLDTAGQLGLRDGSFTVAAWINGSAFESGGNYTILGTDQPELDKGLHLMVHNGKPYMGFYSNDTAGTISLANDRWHHVVWRYNLSGGEQAIFVNGELDIASPGHKPFQGSEMVNVGRSWKSNYFAGLIDEIEIYPRALTDEEIAARFKEPVLHLPLDFDPVDASPYRQAVTCTPAGCPMIDYAGGALGGKATFSPDDLTNSGDSPVLQVPLNPSLDLSEGRFTQAFWVKPAWGDPSGGAPYEPYGIMGSNDGDKNGYPWVQMEPSDNPAEWFLNVGFGDGEQAESLSPAILRSEVWNHVIITYDFPDYEVYINGVSQGGAFSFDLGKPAPVVDGTPLYIGRSASPRSVSLHEHEGCWNENWKWKEQTPTYARDMDGYSLPYWVGDGASSISVINTCATVYQGTWTGDHWDVPFWASTYRVCAEPGQEICGTYVGDAINDRLGAVELETHAYPTYGMLDDVRIYPYAFSDEDVEDLYEGSTRRLELRFDEPPAATELHDSSGSQLVGTCSPPHCPDTGLPGRDNQAARFDGIDDYVTLRHVTEAIENVSLAAWVKWAGPNGHPQVIVYNGVSGHDGYGIALDEEGRLKIINSDAGEAQSDRQLTANVWQHVMAARDDGGHWHLLLNGVPVDLTGNPQPKDPSERTTVGAHSDYWGGWDHFHGMIDHVTIHQGSLPWWDTLMDEAPLLNLHLDDKLGATTFADISHLDHQAACAGTTCPKAGAKGQMREAVVFDGMDDSILADLVTEATDNVSLAAWVKWSGTNGNGQVIVYNGNSGSSGYGLMLDTDGKLEILNGGVAWITSTRQLTKDVWQHVAAVREAGVWKLYVNGSSVIVSGNPAPYPPTDGTAIGSNHVGQGSFYGAIDEVAIYNRALTRRDIKALYDYQLSWFDTTVSHNLTVDADPPTAQLDYTLPYIRPAQGQVMAVTAADAPSGVQLVEYRITGSGYAGNWLSATADGAAWVFTFSPTAGTYTVEVRAWDLVGNVSEINRRVIHVDNTPPDVQIDYALTQNVLPVPADTLTLSGSAEDTASGLDSLYTTLLDYAGIPVGGTQAAQMSGRQVLHLALDEKAGATSFIDMSGSGFTGTCPGGASTCPSAGIQGRIDGAARFDGIDDHLSLGTATALGIQEDSFTVAAWVNGAAFGPGRDHTILGTDQLSTNEGLHLTVRNGKPYMGFYVNDTVGTTTLSNGTWHHLVWRYDKSTGEQAILVNGMLDAANSGRAAFQGRGQVNLGRSLGRSYFYGLLDEVMIYDSALSDTQVQALYQLTLPVSRWQTDHPLPPESNGSYTVQLAAQDRTGNAITTTSSLRIDGTAPFADVTDTGVHTQTLSGVGDHRPVITGTVSETPRPANPVLHLHLEEPVGAERFYDGSRNHFVLTCPAGNCPSAGQPGQAGSAVQFDGASDTLQADLVTQATDQVSLAAWVKWAGPNGSAQFILNNGNSGGNGYGILLDASGQLQIINGGVGYVQSGQPLAVDVWQHVAAVRQAGVWTLYLDGSPLAVTGNPAPNVPVGKTSIGSNDAGGESFNGHIDEALLYDRALTADQVHALANPVSSGVGTTEIGFLHAQDRDTPDIITWHAVELAQPGQAFSTWRYTLPEGLEGPYQIYLRTTDSLGNTRILPNVWEGEIDTQAPRVTFTQGALSQGQRPVTCRAEDYNLVEMGFDCPVAPAGWQRAYEQADWYTAIYGGTAPEKLTRIEASAFVTTTQSALTACDLFDNCTTAAPAALWRVMAPTQTGASLILTPTAGSVWSAIAPIGLAGYVEAPDYARALTVTVNGAPISTTTWSSGAVTATTWTTAWTPGGEGAYALQAALLDWTGHTITSSAEHVIYVDTTPPALTLATPYISEQNWQRSGYLTLEGLVTETVKLERLEVQVETPTTSSPPADTWQAIPLPSGGAWRGPVYAGSAVQPSGDTFTLTVRAVDVAGHTTRITHTLLADAAPPTPVTVTLAYTNSLGVWTVITPGMTLDDVLTPTLGIDWTAASDDSGIAGYRVGWTASPTLTTGQIAGLTGYVSAGSHAQVIGEAQKRYAHVVVQDTYGNQTVQTFGPFYVDTVHTPDHAPLAGAMDEPDGVYRGWMEGGCTLLAADNRASQRASAMSALDEPQKFYATWDLSSLPQGGGGQEGGHLRLAWKGANWDYDGDLFVYLSAPGASTTMAYHPFTPTRPITLPAPANTLIWVQDSQTAELFHWDDGVQSWQVMTSGLSYRFDAPYTDLVVPFTTLGITDPAHTVLGLLALATEEDHMRFWATAPARNVVNSARAADDLQAELRTSGGYGNPTRAYALQLGAGVCPNDEVYSPANVTVRFSAHPAGVEVITYDDGWFTGEGDILDFAIGDGERAVYELELANEGQSPATNVTVVITASELRLDSAPTPVSDFVWRDVLDLGEIAPGERQTVAFSGTVFFNVDNTDEISGFVSVDVSVSYDHSAYVGEPVHMRSMEHRIDYQPPSYVRISQPRTLLGLGVNQVRGVVHDESDVPTVTLQVQAPGGGLSTINCLDVTQVDGTWSCDWDVGTGVTDGDVFNLRARATDRLGQVSAWTRWLTLTVDTQPTDLSLGAATESALTDGWLAAGETTLSGHLADNRLVSQVTVCQVDGQICDIAELDLDPETISQTVFVYDDAPATPIAIGAANACEGGELIVRTFVVSDIFEVSDVQVGFNADLAYRNTVVAALKSPSGQEVILHYPLGYPGRNLDVLWNNGAWDILFDEESPHNTADPYYEHVRRPDQDVNLLSGENAQGTWRLTLCDHFSLAAENGFYNRSRLILSTDRLSDNTRASWRYSLPDVEGQDGVTRTLDLYGQDSVGNRTEPLSMTFQVDTVPPAIVYFTHTPTLRPGEPFFIAGSVSDGGGVRAMQVSGLTPGQEHVADAVTLDYEPSIGSGRNVATWYYTDTGKLTHPGDYDLWVEAIDDAGNRSTFGPLAVQVIVPLRLTKSVTPTENVGLGDLVTYTLTLHNDNAVAIPDIIIVDQLPEAVTPVEMVEGMLFLPPPDHILVWPAFSLGARSTAELVFTARVSDDIQYLGASVVNQAYYYSENASGASNETSFDIYQALTILSPQAGQVISATNGVSVSVPITVVTPFTLPDEGYWALDVDNSAVISQVLGYTATATLGLGDHTIRAVLYTPDQQELGADEVVVTVITHWQRVYVPLVMRGGAP